MTIFLLSIAAFLCAPLAGAGIVMIYGDTHTDFDAPIIALGGGILLGTCVHTVIEDILPSNLPLWQCLLFFAAGLLILLLFKQLLSFFMSHSHHLSAAKRAGARITIADAFLFLLVLSLHTLPEGIAAATFVYSGTYQAYLPFFIALMLHHIPEGIAAALFLSYAGIRKSKLLLSIAIVGIIGVGAVFFGNVVSHLVALPVVPMLCFAIGCMSYLLLFELLPDAFAKAHRVACAVCVLIGFLFMSLLTHLLGA